MKFSVIIPARDEERYLGRCLDALAAAARPYPGEVEAIVALNRCTDRTEAIARARGAVIVREDAPCLAKIRNAAARAARGEILVTIDADSWMSANMLQEIDRQLATGRYIGGGVWVRAERLSPGILASLLVLLPLLLCKHRVSAGLFWLYRRDFEAVGGFNEELVSAEDLDFAGRLKAYGRAQGRRYGTLFRACIRTSCRKFDQLGDWYLLTHPGFVRAILGGRNREAANRLYYDVKR